MSVDATLTAGPAADALTADSLADEPVEVVVERLRGELAAYCYRMLGSAHDTEDALQEVMVRAWRAHDRFEGRAQVRSWLYRIATNVCLDQLRGRRRRALPMALGPAGDARSAPGEPLAGATWVQPLPDRMVGVGDGDGDPAEHLVTRESVRLAFVAALQHLAPRQRAVLILRDVLRWRSAEVATLLDTTPTAVDSTLRRARAALAAARPGFDTGRSPGAVGAREPAGSPSSPEGRALLERYVAAFEGYDLDALTALLHEDATLSMPPHPLWLQGRSTVVAWLAAHEAACGGPRMVPVAANRSLAVAHLVPSGAGTWAPFAVQVLDVRDGRIAAIDAFLDPEVLALFPEWAAPAAAGVPA